jgi:hypothetical protein
MFIPLMQVIMMVVIQVTEKIVPFNSLHSSRVEAVSLEGKLRQAFPEAQAPILLSFPV